MKIIQFPDGKYAVMKHTKRWFLPDKFELLDRDGDWRENPSNWALNAMCKIETRAEAAARLLKNSTAYVVIA